MKYGAQFQRKSTKVVNITVIVIFCDCCASVRQHGGLISCDGDIMVCCVMVMFISVFLYSNVHLLCDSKANTVMQEKYQNCLTKSSQLTNQSINPKCSSDLAVLT